MKSQINIVYFANVTGNRIVTDTRMKMNKINITTKTTLHSTEFFVNALLETTLTALTSDTFLYIIVVILSYLDNINTVHSSDKALH